jgi:hypothetical protein
MRTFVHEMGGEQDNAALFVALDYVPCGSPAVRIHARGGLCDRHEDKAKVRMHHDFAK